MEGLSVLQELPAPLGSILFQRVRDVELWAGIAPKERAALFAAETRGEPVAAASFRTMPEPGLREPLAVLKALVRASGSADPARVADACVRIAEWASERGHSATEMAFAEAATRVRPEEAHLCFVAGRAARRQARYVRAQQWFERCIGLARRAEDWGAYTEAFLGWGIMESRRGRRKEARTRFERAWRSAKRGGFRELQAAARHNLLVLSIPTRDFDKSLSHARAAWRLYGSGTPYLIRLSNDIASLWTEHQHHSAAYRIYALILPLCHTQPERTIAAANLARAAAALQRRDEYLSSLRLVEAELHTSGDSAAEILIQVAEGARSLLLFKKAVGLATQAERIAREREEAEQERTAVELLTSIHEGEPGDQIRPAPPPVRRFTRRIANRLKSLSTSLD